MGSWTWVGRYAVVLLVALLLGGAIGELTVFKQTTLGTPKLSAAALVRFLGLGGGLVMFWLLGLRAASQLKKSRTRSADVGFLILPVTTLIALSAGYDVLLDILRPLLSASLKDLYNWVFVLGISASALWLVAELYRHSEGLIETLKRAPTGAGPPDPKCASCGATLLRDAKFCQACGKAVTG